MNINRGGEPDSGLRNTINELLKDHFGIDTITGLPMWRVSWSQDQYEKRLGTFDDISPAGVYLRTVTEVRLVPKYSQWIVCKYVLENLVVLPPSARIELPSSNISYEPLYVFMDRNGDYLPPSYLVAEFAIQAVYAAKGQGSLSKYTDPRADDNNGLEYQKKRVDKLYEEMYGNESGLGGKIVYGEGVAGFHSKITDEVKDNEPKS